MAGWTLANPTVQRCKLARHALGLGLADRKGGEAFLDRATERKVRTQLARGEGILEVHGQAHRKALRAEQRAERSAPHPPFLETKKQFLSSVCSRFSCCALRRVPAAHLISTSERASAARRSLSTLCGRPRHVTTFMASYPRAIRGKPHETA